VFISWCLIKHREDFTFTFTLHRDVEIGCVNTLPCFTVVVRILQQDQKQDMTAVSALQRVDMSCLRHTAMFGRLVPILKGDAMKTLIKRPTLVTVLCVVTPCSDVVGYHRLASTSNPHSFHPEDGGSKVLRNFGILPHHHTVS